MSKKVALSILAHPDDAEFMCTGTLALLHQAGWEVHTATMTAGDCGSQELTPGEISRIRRNEATDAVKILDGTYTCLECIDLNIFYDKATLQKVTDLIRHLDPQIVFTASPKDYMVDHENTSRLVQTACFGAGIPNYSTPGQNPTHSIPHLYYVDALGGKDIMGNELKPTTLVNTTTVMDIKEAMLCAHASQRNWLKAHHGIDEYIINMHKFAKERGKMADCDAAEGFRQHLGHAYPKDNILKTALPEYVQELKH